MQARQGVQAHRVVSWMAPPIRGPVATPVLELTGISKRFGAVQALSDASLEV